MPVSFVVDPPLLIAAGAVTERWAPSPRHARVLQVGTLAVFIGAAAAMYANAPGLRWMWVPFGSSSGRDFMVNSGFLRIGPPATPIGHAAALAVLATYPAWFRLGRRLGRRPGHRISG